LYSHWYKPGRPAVANEHEPGDLPGIENHYILRREGRGFYRREFSLFLLIFAYPSSFFKEDFLFFKRMLTPLQKTLFVA
jgi:hypothetical protein